MKKHFFIISVLCTMMCMMVSCHKDDDVRTVDEIHAAILDQYVSNTISPTYMNLATYTEQLVTDLQALRADKSQSNLNHA